MRANAFTFIICPTRDPAQSWHVRAADRLSAEMLYGGAILNSGMTPPMYRIVVQLKVDQHDAQGQQLSIACN